MRLVRVTAGIAVIGVLGGCAHEKLAWPPKPDDVARINHDAKEELGWLRIEYVDPLQARRDIGDLKQIAIGSIDPDQIGFLTREGETRLVPADMVEGVTVKDRDRGGLIGALIGLGSATAATAAIWLLYDAQGNCEVGCSAKETVFTYGVSVGLGVMIGYWISGRRTFHFERAR